MNVMMKSLMNRAWPLQKALFVMTAGHVFEGLLMSRLDSAEVYMFACAMPLLLAVEAIGYGMGAGIAVHHVRAQGRSGLALFERDSIRLMALLGCCVFLALTLLLVVLRLFSGGGVKMISYLLLWALCLPFSLSNYGRWAILRAGGQCHRVGRLMLYQTLLLCLLLPIGVFGWGPIPGYGLHGAAATTVVVSVVVCIMSGNLPLLLFWRPLAPRRFAITVRRCLQIGVPATASNLLVPLSGAAVTFLLSYYAPSFIAGYALALRLEAFYLVIFYGLSAAIGPLVAQRYWFGEAAVLEQIQDCLKNSLKIGLLIAIAAYLFAQFISAFSNGDTDVELAMNRYFTSVPWAYGAYGCTMLITAILNAINNPYRALWITITRFILLIFFLCPLFLWSFGGPGIFYAIALSHMISALASYIVLARRLHLNTAVQRNITRKIFYE